MAKEWIQLTPPEEAIAQGCTSFYRHGPSDSYPHQIMPDDNEPNFIAELSDAELAALPPVKARDVRIAKLEVVTEAAREIRTALETNAAPMRVHYALRKVGHARLDAALLTFLLDALTALEADDAE
jgi:hypothetical protein